MRWDLYVRVVDNFGDAGVGWRLAAGLAARGESVRLFIDDPAPLAWMAPRGADGVRVFSWADAADAAGEAGGRDGDAGIGPGEVVIELFGSEPPPAVLAAMARQPRPPLWIDLEHLSAEPYVERSHGLPSPQQAGPGRGLTRWFYFPGFTPRTGGLLREDGLMAAREAFDAAGWRAANALPAAAGGPCTASVFCYDHPGTEPLAGLHLLLAPGAAQRRFGARAPATALPWLDQPAYDRLLWSCALNIVRGEDSFVRAQWAGVPFVWHIYPQHDGAHAHKLEAFLDRFLDGAEPAFAHAVRALWRGWNGLAPAPAPSVWPVGAEWTAACLRWRAALLAQDDLVTSLLRFVADRR